MQEREVQPTYDLKVNAAGQKMLYCSIEMRIGKGARSPWHGGDAVDRQIIGRLKMIVLGLREVERVAVIHAGRRSLDFSVSLKTSRQTAAVIEKIDKVVSAFVAYHACH